MTTIANNIITINRGDSLTLPFTLNIGSTRYPVLYDMVEGDTLYFGLMEPHQPFEVALVRKSYDYTMEHDHDVIITLRPEDTEFLVPGTYYYSIKLKKNTGEVYTLLSNSKFIIID